MAEIVIDMRDKYVNTIIDAVQYDKNSRIVKASLLSGGSRFSIPTGATYRVNFKRADGASGSYTELSDGSSAVVRSESNVLKIGIHELVTNTSGKTFISVSIIEGTSEISTFSFVVNVQKAVAEISDLNKKYPNTYDATATPEDIAKGMTAYANGDKITGALQKIDSATAEVETISYSNGEVVVKGIISNDKKICNPGSTMKISIPASTFGDAIASDVSENKTFTSASGLKVSGSLVKAKQLGGVASSVSRHSISGAIMVKGNPSGRHIVDTDTVLTLNAPKTEFGTAKAEDVAKGKTFTSESGLKIEGTHECEGGIDTSDATATSDDMATGKTAYVNGVKVTGRLPESKGLTVLGGETTFYVDSANNDGVAVAGVQNSDTIIRAGTSVKVVASYDKFGDAQASDVAKGKKFTSAAGLTVTGTHVCEGGIDTSDATANPWDMASGATAYVDGEKIEGTLIEVPYDETEAAKVLSAGDYAKVQKSGDLIVSLGRYASASIGDNTKGVILRPGAIIGARMPAEMYGNASAADVAKGKTFTSAAGVRVEGTNEGGGSIEHIYTVDYTPAVNTKAFTVPIDGFLFPPVYVDCRAVTEVPTPTELQGAVRFSVFRDLNSVGDAGSYAAGAVITKKTDNGGDYWNVHTRVTATDKELTVNASDQNNWEMVAGVTYRFLMVEGYR